ncbi:MAG: NADH-quinone oxidoreductase subunit D [Actinomycetes bacterium]
MPPVTASDACTPRTAAREVVYGVGLAGALTADLPLGLGPEHPTSHGALHLRVVVAGHGADEVVISAEPRIGLLHRGAEKLYEARDYRQGLMLADRHDWLSPFGNELGLALVIERMLGLEVPPRAVWLRMVLAELTRVSASLPFLGGLAGALPVTPASDDSDGVRGQLRATSWRLREMVLDLLEAATGARVHLQFTRVGGLLADVPAGWPGLVRATLPDLRAGLAELRLLLSDEAVAGPLTGLAHLDPALVPAYGLTGPVARASGSDLDLRRDDPYLSYGELFAPGGPGRVPVSSNGDALARVQCLREPCDVALDLVEVCLDRLETDPRAARGTPVNVRLPKVLRLPEGQAFGWLENASGASGYYLVSSGDKTPWRLKLRTPSYSNLQPLGELLPGTPVALLPAALASVFVVIGDVDK